MQFALPADGSKARIKVQKTGDRGVCPICKSRVDAKAGEKISHHWAHHSRDDCDTWAEGKETDWHIGWKDLFPESWQEITVGGEHRADVRTDSGTVIEFQNSPIAPDIIRDREEFYGDMIWVINAKERIPNFGPVESEQTIRGPITYAYWPKLKNKKSPWLEARKPLFIDIDGIVFRLNSGTGADRLWGTVMTKDEFVAACRSGKLSNLPGSEPLPPLRVLRTEDEVFAELKRHKWGLHYSQPGATAAVATPVILGLVESLGIDSIISYIKDYRTEVPRHLLLRTIEGLRRVEEKEKAKREAEERAAKLRRAAVEEERKRWWTEQEAKRKAQAEAAAPRHKEEEQKRARWDAEEKERLEAAKLRAAENATLEEQRQKEERRQLRIGQKQAREAEARREAFFAGVDWSSLTEREVYAVRASLRRTAAEIRESLSRWAVPFSEESVARVIEICSRYESFTI